MGQDTGTSDQSKNIIEEIQELNDMSRDPNRQTFRKTTYWHKQSMNIGDEKSEIFSKEIIEVLLRIEDKLTKIESFLKNKYE